MKAIERAVELVGSQRKLASLCGTSQQRVWNWINRDSAVPAECCAAVEQATGGAVTRHDLRPDIFEAPEKTTAA